MYGVRLYQNAPAPEPVSSDDLIAAHDYPAWKKNAAGLHPGFDQLRDYPERLPAGTTCRITGTRPYDRNWGPQEGGFAPGKRLD